MSNPSLASVTPSELRGIGLFGALSDDVLTHLASTLSVHAPESGDNCCSKTRDARRNTNASLCA